MCPLHTPGAVPLLLKSFLNIVPSSLLLQKGKRACIPAAGNLSPADDVWGGQEIPKPHRNMVSLCCPGDAGFSGLSSTVSPSNLNLCGAICGMSYISDRSRPAEVSGSDKFQSPHCFTADVKSNLELDPCCQHCCGATQGELHISSGYLLQYFYPLTHMKYL